jgi:hypothetical protein
VTIDQVIAELQRIDDELRAFLAPLSEGQANWQPDKGRRWSIRQNIQHMAVTNDLYVGAMRRGLAGGPKQHGSDLAEHLGPWGRWFLGILEPPPRLKALAPPRVQPRSEGSLQDAFEGFLRSQEAARAVAREAAQHDLRATFPNPFFGLLRVRVATGLLVVPAHDRRHLWQMRQVVTARNFPAA